MSNGQTVKAVTIIVQFTNEEGLQKRLYPGFLTGYQHAMYIENSTSSPLLLFAKVDPTDDPRVYVENPSTSYCSLGQLDKVYDAEELIERLSHTLHTMTAYELMMKVIVFVKSEIEFEGLIIPKLLNEGGQHVRNRS